MATKRKSEAKETEQETGYYTAFSLLFSFYIDLSSAQEKEGGGRRRQGRSEEENNY